jgi:hypothetical protein
MFAHIVAAVVAAYTPPLMSAPELPCPPGYELNDMVAPERLEPSADPPYGDALGDAWEMQEVACWRGFWLRRGRSDLFDAYWVHPRGERVKATLQMWRTGRSVTVVRRHTAGRYCRYDGTISPDWWSIEGRYTSTWQRTPMAWRARIIRLEQSLPQLLR